MGRARRTSVVVQSQGKAVVRVEVSRLHCGAVVMSSDTKAHRRKGARGSSGFISVLFRRSNTFV